MSLCRSLWAENDTELNLRPLIGILSQVPYRFSSNACVVPVTRLLSTENMHDNGLPCSLEDLLLPISPT